MKVIGIILMLLLPSFLDGSEPSAKSAEQLPIPMISIAGADLGGHYENVMPEGVDISPDASKAAVVFEVGEAPKTITTWIGIFDVSSHQLLRSTRVDGPLTDREMSNPQLLRAVRYSPDGRSVVVQTGPRICVLNAETLATKYSVAPSELMPSTQIEVIRSFDISKDEERLAVLTVGIFAPDEDSRIAVQIIDLVSGRRLAQWQLPGHSRNVSISPDGTRVLIDKVDNFQRLALVESTSGELLRTLDSGWKMGSGQSKFIDSHRIAAVPEIGTDEKGRFFGDGLKVFSTDTGALLKEVKCLKFGSTATLAVSTAGHVIASISAFQTPREVRSDNGIHKSKPELVIFDADDGTCRSVLSPLPHGQFKSTLDQYSLRLSADGSVVVFFEDTVAKVYRIGNRR